MSGSVRNRPCAVALALVLALGLGLAAEPPAAPAPSPAAPGAPQVPFADLLPADVLASARLGPIPELIRRFRAAALDGLPADRRAECAQALDAACRDAGAEILARLHVDLAPVLAHTLALHVAVVEIWTGIETVRPHLLIGVETDDAALPAAWIDSALAAVESDRMEHGEHLIHELALSSEEGALAAIYAAPAGRFLLAATAAAFVGAALDRSDAGCVAAAAASRTPDGPAATGAGAGGAPSVRSPGTAAPEWARRVAEVPAAAGMPLAAHADTRRIAAALRRALGRAALREIEECEARFGLDALAALDLRCEWVESTVSARLDVALRGETELLAALRSPGGRHEAFRVAVPQDAVFAVSARFPDLAATWTALRRLLERHEETREEEPARREFARALAEFER
ncbi:MAG: hypothetical protein HZA54_06075, partial [Planctomycetes bacterium]|nr:hypothetical protein [Planctomycetota bacterium]